MKLKCKSINMFLSSMALVENLVFSNPNFSPNQLPVQELSNINKTFCINHFYEPTFSLFDYDSLIKDERARAPYQQRSLSGVKSVSPCIRVMITVWSCVLDF